MKVKLYLLVAFVCSLFFVKGQVTGEKSPFRIVGYYSLQQALTGDVGKMPFDKLTHINLYFLNPDSLGNFPQNLTALSAFVKAAHAQHVKVLFSIAGGGRHPYYTKLLQDSNRAKLVDRLCTLVLQYDLDGIDVDIEGSDMDENYDNFVIELAAALHQHNKLITAAVAVFYKGDYTDKALAQYDFMNVMSYDHTGSWAPEKPGPHSTYAQATADIAYFKTVRGIPKEKLTLGVPFYGYGFGPTLATPGIDMNYSEIVAQFPGAEWKEEVKTGNGKTLYYNGIPIIRKKTALAKKEASGIMIWQLQGDAPGAKSLLKAIAETAAEKQ